MTNKPMPVFLTLLLGVALYAAPASLRGAEQTSEHCIVGLFEPDRVSDLHKAMADIPEFQLVHLDYETARATFHYDLMALFPTFDPRRPPTDAQIEERLSRLLADASNDTFVLKPCSKIPREKLTKLEIKIGLLDCKGCRYGTYLLVMKEEGVEQATVDKIVTAWIDPAKTSQAAIEAALKKGGVELLEKK